MDMRQMLDSAKVAMAMHITLTNGLNRIGHNFDDYDNQVLAAKLVDTPTCVTCSSNSTCKGWELVAIMLQEYINSSPEERKAKREQIELQVSSERDPNIDEGDVATLLIVIKFWDELEDKYVG
jgi:hypothetical protein